MKKTIATLVMMCLLYSCISTSEAEMFSTIKFRNDTDYSKYDKIRFDGYYCGRYMCMSGSELNVEYNAIVFYKDGSMININFKSRNDIDKPIHNLSSIWVTDPGIAYRIDGDTIKCEEYRNSGPPKWDYWKRDFIILNKDSLMSFYANYPQLNLIYKFIESPLLPDAINVKLKKKKWMWANKKEWKEYKRKVKEYNDSLKHLSGK